MDKRLLQLIQVASLVMGVWLAFSILHRLGDWVVIVVATIAGLNAALAWALRYQRQAVGLVYTRPLIKNYVDLICRLTGVQPPVEHAGGRAESELLLASTEDYAQAAASAKQIVRGHDDALDTMFARVRETVQLRQKRTDNAAVLPPLASFVLVGNEGTGRRYAARVLAKLLYRSGAIAVCDADQLGADAAAQVFGSKGQPGWLTESVRRQPFQVIVVERIDAAAPEFVQQLSATIRQGSCTDADSGQAVSFMHCVFVLTTSKCQATLGALQQKGIVEKAWHRQAEEVLAAETLVDPALFAATTEIILCAPMTDLVRAEVIAMLMEKEAAAYGIALTHVDPEILVAEVVQLNDSTGFGMLPERIKKVLHKSLLAATQQDRKTMALRYARRERKPLENQL